MKTEQNNPLQHIFVVNPKGGSGKTTIATQLAGWYASADTQVILADHDPQKSSSDWHALRPSSCKTIELMTVPPDKAIAAPAGSIVIHDMPAGWTPTLNSGHFSKKTQHKMLVPMMPSPTDIKAGLRFVMALHRSGTLENQLAAGVLANRARGSIRYNRVLIEFLERIDLPLLTSIRDTQNYIRAMEHGISIFDLPPSAVKHDIEQWQAIIGWLGPR